MNKSELMNRIKNPRKDVLVLGLAYIVSYIVPNPVLFNNPFTSYGVPAPVFVAEVNFQSLGAVPAEPTYLIFWMGVIVNAIFWILAGAASIYLYRRWKKGDSE